MAYVNPIPYIEKGKEFELRVRVVFDEVVELKEAKQKVAEFIKNMPVEELASALACLEIKAVFGNQGCISKGGMIMLGGGPYEATTCPECGSVMWNGRCENTDCEYHWNPKDDEGGEED